MSLTAQTLNVTRRSIPALALACMLLSAAAACTPSTEGGGTGLASRTPSVSVSRTPGGTPATTVGGPLTHVRLTVAEGANGRAAAGHSLNVPYGWTAEVWADVPGARLAAWAPDGRLLVSTGDGGTVELLTPTTPGSAPQGRVLLDGLGNPQGLGFAEVDGRAVLVVGQAARIVAWDYADGAVSNERVLVDRLPSSGHGSKAVTIDGGTVFYSLGSSGNKVPVDRTESPQRATVWQVGLDGSEPRVVAVGVRNGFGLGVAPDKTLFTAVNQSDNQAYPYHDDTKRYGEVAEEYVNENPIEQVTRLLPGTDLGWPFCVPDTRARQSRMDVPYINDPLLNPDGDELDCGALPNTMVGLPAHSAPLGLAFTAGTTMERVLGSGALITAHGSWNRQPPRPPYVAFSVWDDETATLGEPVELVTGFQNEDGSRWGRSVTAIPGPDGSLYITDDHAGLVYRLTPGA